MKTIEKILKMGLIFTLLIFLLTTENCLPQEKSKFNRFFPTWTVSFYKFTVPNMPLFIRDVPAHPDDGNPHGIAPIAQETYDLSVIVLAGLSYIDTISSNIGFEIGASIFSVDNGDKVIRNYTNAPGTDKRGYGAALTFCELSPRGIFGTIWASMTHPAVDIIPKMSLFLILDRDIDMYLGVSFSYFSIRAVNGWDRYDNNEYKDAYTLAHCFPISLQVHLKSFFGGLEFIPMKYTEVGKQSGLKGGIGFHIGFKPGF